MSTRSRLIDAAGLIVAVVVGAIVAYVALLVIGKVGWPAFNSSNVTRALTTVGQAAAIAVLVVAVIAYRLRRWTPALPVLSAAGMAGLVTITLGMPLGATKLYLGGLSVDQQFRTEYLTRLTDSPHLADMTYHGLAPYYPAGWFWMGGRFAQLDGLPGWEAYKPWSILSIAVAAALATALWNRMIGTDRGIAVSLAVTVVTLMYAAPEPYGAVLILLGVPMLVVFVHALRGPATSWPAVIASGLFIGLSATFYTLFTGLLAGITILLTLWFLIAGWLATSNKAMPDADIRALRRKLVTGVVGRLVVMGAIAGVIALLAWAPYLSDRLSATAASGGSAEHYLPESGSLFPMPMFDFSLVGVLTLIGLVWVLLRFRQRTIALAFAAAIVGVYVVVALSLLRTATGSTLLSFRLGPVLIAILSAAGIFGVAELARAAVGKFGDVRFVVGALGAIVAVAMAQSVPGMLSSDVTTAYTDTDGTGVRADKKPAGAESYFPKIHQIIREQTGKPADKTIVLTADYGFLSLYPYWGFQGLTSHYANPLAEFDKRAKTIERWSTITTPDEMIAALDKSPWTAPTVFLFRYSADGYTLKLAEDVYPNDPNVRRYTVTYQKSAFADPRFRVTEVGPFILVVREGHT
ncbi:arabinosyltransferase AftA [Gordonia effusa NBRC 100432]|uniref:Galactan 5-O-arabinofuranosyltransferase n=1 Tax=Gordonia effusa NBRC 100432 TaxID=1077974 RepID=H0R117_9ACTN|nr:galactan 5-O-arabinofuranosyltransferase [Gordonia effusa]GAB18768.1 arabinosyltransferase AftA [Gordonia effusa NBRC 100432]